VAGTVLDLEMRILNPDGFLTEQRSFLAVVEDSLTRRSRVTNVVELVGAKVGLWRVQIIAAEAVIGDLTIEVRLTEQDKPAVSSEQPSRRS
jgi:hypothetical protein